MFPGARRSRRRGSPVQPVQAAPVEHRRRSCARRAAIRACRSRPRSTGSAGRARDRSTADQVVMIRQVPRTGLAFEEVLQILAHRLPARQVEHRAIDDEDHDAVMGIGGELQAFRAESIDPGLVGLVEGDNSSAAIVCGLPSSKSSKSSFVRPRIILRRASGRRRPARSRAGAEHRRLGRRRRPGAAAGRRRWRRRGGKWPGRQRCLSRAWLVGTSRIAQTERRSSRSDLAARRATSSTRDSPRARGKRRRGGEHTVRTRPILAEQPARLARGPPVHSQQSHPAAVQGRVDARQSRGRTSVRHSQHCRRSAIAIGDRIPNKGRGG